MKIRCDLMDEIARSKTQCRDDQLSVEADAAPFIYGFRLFIVLTRSLRKTAERKQLPLPTHCFRASHPA